MVTSGVVTGVSALVDAALDDGVSAVDIAGGFTPLSLGEPLSLPGTPDTVPSPLPNMPHDESAALIMQREASPAPSLMNLFLFFIIMITSFRRLMPQSTLYSAARVLSNFFC